jgi:hypothetical protein
VILTLASGVPASQLLTGSIDVLYGDARAEQREMPLALGWGAGGDYA